MRREQQREREEIEAGHAARDMASAPLGTMNLGLSVEELGHKLAAIATVCLEYEQDALFNRVIGRSRQACRA